MEQKIIEIVEYLNEVANKKFRPTSESTTRRIRARLQNGYTVDDFKRVIDVKVNEWKDNATMNKYIRPDTLFGRNFESYLNQEEQKETVPESNDKIIYKVEGYQEYLHLMMKMDYKHYINTDHWIHFRKEAIKFFGYQCQLCNEKNEEIHIHHKTYENRGRETFNDVIALCSDCHKLVHGIKKDQTN